MELTHSVALKIVKELENTIAWPDFRISQVKPGFNTVRLTLRFTGICSELNLGQLWASYSSLFLQKSEKQWKLLSVCLKHLP